MRITDDENASHGLAFLFLMPLDDLAIERSLGVPLVLVNTPDLADRFGEQSLLFIGGGEVVLDASVPGSALVSVIAESE